MALISIPAPKELSKIQIPGIKVNSDEFHITLMYLGDNISQDVLLKSVISCNKVCSNTKKFEVSINYVTMFSRGKYGFPIIGNIDSVDLYDFQSKLSKEFESNNITFKNDFGFYRPHVTLAFSDFVAPNQPINTSWVVSHINIWPEDKGRNKEIQIPLY
jgi:2'-5' RNA ligase